MNFSFVHLEKRPAADLLILPYWEDLTEAGTHPLKAKVHPLLKSGDFKGKMGECALVYPEGEKEGRILLLGLGKKDKSTPETLRRAYANALRFATGKKAKSLNVVLPSHSKEETLCAVVEGLLLANYTFSMKKDHAKDLVERIGIVGDGDAKLLERLQILAEGVHFARDLVNENSDQKPPKFLADTAVSFEKLHGVKTTIHDKKWLEQEGMGLILAVARGSSLDPYLIQTSYEGNPGSKERIVLVGKGITYDTGGFSLKTPDNMMTQKSDMAGAATVLGTVRTAAKLGLKVNVTALVPTAENAIGPKSYKLGDVYRSYAGKTVEINNTDAEGRLILADALAYAAKNLHPTFMIDIATLTGSIIIGLGEEIAGFYTHEDQLAQELMQASNKTGELLWRMPFYPDYKDALKSEIADLMNSGGRDAGAGKGALFLEEFVGTVPWVHIDFAGPSYLTKPKYYYTSKGTGYGVRLFIDFLERRALS